MALTEKQREIALRVGRDVAQTMQLNEPDGFLEFAARFLAALPKPEAVGHQYQDDDGKWREFINQKHYENTLADGTWMIRAIYTEAPSPPPASEQKPVALPFAIFDHEIADLRRFHECAMDDEGYDVPKDRMKRLAEIGLVRRVTANYYEHTDFGLSVLNGDFDTAPQPDYKAQLDNLVESIRPLIKSRMGAEAIRESSQAAIASVKGGE